MAVHVVDIIYHSLYMGELLLTFSTEFLPEFVETKLKYMFKL